MPVIKTSISATEEQEKLLQEKMQEWSIDRSGAIRRIMAEWKQYDEMFYCPAFAEKVKAEWQRDGGG